ncbi:gluconokinase [Microcella sp.]|uniref:gluconokinase n=1 Tax=Microcella sp. TaxID=1913979 RepID=UPI0025D17933|nr:gluconokinase [Microcella sp.]
MSIVIVMGVAGSGKSTVAALLAERLAVPYLDADSLHSVDSVQKMAHGEPLSDDDRWPWLDRVADAVESARGTGGIVVACSALRVAYRDAIRRGRSDVFFAHLAAPASLIADRLSARPDHYMPASLLESQLATLEALTEQERGAQLDASQTPEEIVDEIEREITL